MELSIGRREVSNLVLGGGFFLTGTGTVMLGIILPALSNEWGLSDEVAGSLFFMQFIGASLGAVITGANHIRWLKIGYSLLAGSTCVLAFSGMLLVFPAFFLYGLGLGIAMTSTSLVFADRYRENYAAHLQRLNFAWAVGATTAPVLILPFLGMATLKLLFLTLLGLFLALLAWVLLRERQEPPSFWPAPNRGVPRNSLPQGSLAVLVVLAICAVGIEASLSGWLTTYSRRADPSQSAGAVLAISLFWFGVTFSRLVFSTRLLAVIGNQRVLRIASWGLAVSVIMLIGMHTPLAIRVGSALAGLSLGPIYPLLLSFMLEFTRRGWIFAVGGAGAAFFPWFTGLLSTHYGSLRHGLIAPCGAALLMVALGATSLQGKAKEQQQELYIETMANQLTDSIER
jgi:fucose permease